MTSGLKTVAEKQPPSIRERTELLAKSIATRMDRGAPVHRDEMEQLKLLTKFLMAKKQE